MITARIRRLESAPPILRPLKPSVAMVEALDRISRLCSTRFANAVSAGRVLKTEKEVSDFAALPDDLIGQADLAGVHDAATLAEFLGDVPLMETARYPSPN
jgi:hypothetical protein